MWKHELINGLDYYFFGGTRRRVKTFNTTEDMVDFMNSDLGVKWETLDDNEKCAYNYENIAKDDTLPSGIYRMVYKRDKLSLLKFNVYNRKDLLDIGPTEQILADFDLFKESEEVYKSLNLIYKKGVILCGPPGTGKTSAINLIINKLNKEDALVFYITDKFPESFIEVLKKEDRLKIFIFEEITEIIENQSIEYILNFLDGENSLNRCYTIATTNYPEKLPDNLAKRPGRFDKFFYMGNIIRGDIRIYWEAQTKKKISDEDLDLLDVNITLAQLKEILLVVLRDKKTIKEAIKLMKDHTNSFNQKCGFI